MRAPAAILQLRGNFQTKFYHYRIRTIRARALPILDAYFHATVASQLADLCVQDVATYSYCAPI